MLSSSLLSQRPTLSFLLKLNPLKIVAENSLDASSSSTSSVTNPSSSSSNDDSNFYGEPSSNTSLPQHSPSSSMSDLLTQDLPTECFYFSSSLPLHFALFANELIAKTETEKEEMFLFAITSFLPLLFIISFSPSLSLITHFISLSLLPPS